MNGYIRDYIRKRKRRAKNLSQHKGTNEEFYALVEKKSRIAGKQGLCHDWKRSQYTRDLFEAIQDPRMLFRSWDSLKGHAAGSDGVGVTKIGRYYVYRLWCKRLKLYGKDRVPFEQTVFFDAPTQHVAALSIALEPGHSYRLRQVMLRPENDGDTINHADFPLNCLFNKTDSERDEFYGMAECAGVNVAQCSDATITFPQCPDQYIRKLQMAGIEPTALKELHGEIVKQVVDFFSMRGRLEPKARIYEFTPANILLEASKGERDGLDHRNRHLLYSAMRWIGEMLSKMAGDGHGYTPQQLHQVSVSKRDGSMRTLSLPTAVDRIVDKSALLVLQPMFEEIFLPCSIGFRTDRDRFDVLAALEEKYPSAPGKWILCADIRKAFDNIRHDDLLRVIDKYVVNPDVRKLLHQIVRRPGVWKGNKGIAQGCPLSPLFMNILLHDALDAPLSQILPGHLIYFRYADDICVFGLTSEGEGQNVINLLQDLLSEVGLELHTEAPKTRIVNLAPARDNSCAIEINEVDSYLGVGLRGREDNTLEFFLPSFWQDDLYDLFTDAVRNNNRTRKRDLTSHLGQIARSWLRAYAPAWAASDEDAVAESIAMIASEITNGTVSLEPESLARSWRGYFEQYHESSS